MVLLSGFIPVNHILKTGVIFILLHTFLIDYEIRQQNANMKSRTFFNRFV